MPLRRVASVSLLTGLFLAPCSLPAETGAADVPAAAGADAALLSVVADAPAHAGKSAEEIARELANPNNSLASLTFKNQFRFYDGDLLGADDQSNYTMLFQPVFPFTMPETASGAKANLFVRPAIPFLFDQPVFSSGDGTFDDVSGIGDIGFDVGYGVTEKSGLLWALGTVGSLPTASDASLASGQLRLGPELLLAKFNDWGVIGIFPSHLWDVTGWEDTPYSNTQIQPIFKLLPGGGWNVGTAPLINYDWKDEQWTIPLNLAVSKTLKVGNMPVKVELEANYYVERNDAFGPEWMFGLNITPVVPNFVEKWFRK